LARRHVLRAVQVLIDSLGTRLVGPGVAAAALRSFVDSADRMATRSWYWSAAKSANALISLLSSSGDAGAQPRRASYWSGRPAPSTG